MRYRLEKVRDFVRGIIERLRGIPQILGGESVDADFSAQLEAFRRTEAQHRNTYRELSN